MLIESGEPVVLFGWHRAVYQIWLSKLKQYNPAMYTGSESPTQKAESARRFIEGETPLLIVSVRAGAGLDGLQTRTRIGVVGELDWSPGVIEQNIGRFHRDGQSKGSLVYFLVAEEGSDPIMSEVLGVKREQADGIVNPDGAGSRDIFDASGTQIQKLAVDYLTRKGLRVDG